MEKEKIVQRRNLLVSDLEMLDKQIATLDAKLHEALTLKERMLGAIQVIDELLQGEAIESPEEAPQP